MRRFFRKSLSGTAAMRTPPVLPDPVGDQTRHYPPRQRTEAHVAGRADCSDPHFNRRRNRAVQTAETRRTPNIKIDNEPRFSPVPDGDPDDSRRDQPINLMPGLNQADPRIYLPSGSQRVARDPGRIGYPPGNRDSWLRVRPGRYRNDNTVPANVPMPVQPQRHRHPAMRRPA